MFHVRGEKKGECAGFMWKVELKSAGEVRVFEGT